MKEIESHKVLLAMLPVKGLIVISVSALRSFTIKELDVIILDKKCHQEELSRKLWMITLPSLVLVDLH